VARLGAYILPDDSFVRAWSGRESDVDLLLTPFVAVQTDTLTEALMTNYLYRAGGFVAEDARALSVLERNALLSAQAPLRVLSQPAR
jgi:hypothetical protein